MLVSQIKLIGQAFIGEKSTFNVLVDKQKQYNAKYIAVVNWDPESKDYYVELEEYDHEKRYHYARGATSGNSVNFSPCVNMNWTILKTDELLNKFIENPEEEKEFAKIVNVIQKIGNIKNKISENFENPYGYSVFLEWINEKAHQIRIKIVKKLYEMASGLKKNDKPQVIIFKFKDPTSGDYLYPGDLNYVKEAYIFLAGMGELSKENEGENESNGICAICNKKARLMKGFNFGGFTLDQEIFNNNYFMSLEKDLPTQFVICQDCLNYCNEGYNTIEKNLKFYAYSEKNMANTIPIHYFLIPLISDLRKLKEVIERIAKIKEDYDEYKSSSILSEITALNNKLLSISKKEQGDLKAKIKNLEKQKMKFDQQTNVDIPESYLINKIKDYSIPYICLYYKETDKKQNPTTKEVVKFLVIEAPRISQIADAIENTDKILGQNGFFPFRWLRDIVGTKGYLEYIEALFLGKKISKSQFLRNANTIMTQAWLYRLFEIKDMYYRSKAKNFKTFFTLFDYAKIF